MFNRIALHSFVKNHPPQADVRPPEPDAIKPYEGQVPDSLLQLWRKHGWGFYGKRQIALVDPARWQPVLDRWIVSPPDQARRVPIALTPFGLLIYYRKLSEHDEDIAYIDPQSRQTEVLSWSLDDFFKRFLADDASLESLIPAGTLRVAQSENGPLAFEEIYAVDPMMLSMQMLKIDKTDALAWHQTLRAAVDPVEPPPPPLTLRDAIPAEQAARLDDIDHDGDEHPIAGLYVSRYLDWYRLLALGATGRYQLLFWRIHDKTGARQEIREYGGVYTLEQDAQGDTHVSLDIKLNPQSLGSDANDQALVLSSIGGVLRLLRTPDLPRIADQIARRQRLGHSERYFNKMRLDDMAPDWSSDGEPVGDVAAATPVALRSAHA